MVCLSYFNKSFLTLICHKEFPMGIGCWVMHKLIKLTNKWVNLIKECEKLVCNTICLLYAKHNFWSKFYRWSHFLIFLKQITSKKSSGLKSRSKSTLLVTGVLPVSKWIKNEKRKIYFVWIMAKKICWVKTNIQLNG